VVQVEKLHPELVEIVGTGGLLNFVFVDDLLEALAFSQSKDVLCYMSKVDVLLE